MDLYSARYENIALLGYFNVNINAPCVESFCDLYGFSSLIKDPTCFKNPENPSCIDLRLCQTEIDFLFGVTRAHAKKPGTWNLFIQKLARRSFLFIIGEKNNNFHIFQF